ncbi:hypothetical protein ACEN9X_10090 [Mucilaginibacter sp. Mucisp86]|uniref:hypothetical protein n=1 Tax=Mucilaginibacter sp. Mucisp86 TaxID=3243060 RepID=UPI0039B610CC
MMQLKLFDIEPAYERFNVSGAAYRLTAKKCTKVRNLLHILIQRIVSCFYWFIDDGSWIAAAYG